MDAYIITPRGEMTLVEPKNGKDFQLDELQEIVGGYIEVVRLSSGRLMVINEEGKLRGLAANEHATKLFPNRYDFIVGTVLVCRSDQLK